MQCMAKAYAAAALVMNTGRTGEGAHATAAYGIALAGALADARPALEHVERTARALLHALHTGPLTELPALAAALEAALGPPVGKGPPAEIVQLSEFVTKKLDR